MSEFKSIANTAIVLGPITIPVRVYSAVEHHSGAHMCHRHDDGWGYKISLPPTCDECHEVVPRNQSNRTLDKPTATSKKLKVLTDEELAALKGDPEGEIGKELNVLHWVHADEVAPTVCDTVRYLDPDQQRSQAAAESYASLYAMLEENRLVAVAYYALRATPHQAVIHPAGNGLLIVQHVTWMREFAVKPATPNQKFMKLMAEFAQQEMVEGFGSPEYIAAHSITRVMPAAGDDADEVPEDVIDLVAKLEAVVKVRERRAAKPRRTRKPRQTQDAA